MSEKPCGSSMSIDWHGESSREMKLVRSRFASWSVADGERSEETPRRWKVWRSAEPGGGGTTSPAKP